MLQSKDLSKRFRPSWLLDEMVAQLLNHLFEKNSVMVNTSINRNVNPSELSEAERRGAKAQALILTFEEVGIADIPLVGGKNASLGEMIQQLTPKGVKIPTGFATTARAYRYFIQHQPAGVPFYTRRVKGGGMPERIKRH